MTTTPTTPVQKHLSILGHKVKDQVTQFEGVAASVCFDLYGCIQVALNPGMGKDGKLQDCVWFDINRLVVLSKKPVMEVPNFDYGPVADGAKGPAEKPKFMKA